MKHTYQHTIDLLFPIALFFVFSATALITLLFSADIYQTITADSESAFEQSTCLSYLTTKIRQQDQNGTDTIYLGTFDGYDALVIEQDIENTSYVTYIYEANGKLKELFLQKGAAASSKSGTTIMTVKELSMETIAEGMLKFSCTSEIGDTDSVLIHLSSETPSP